MSDIRALLSKYKIIPDPMKDQFFLEDEKVIKKMVDLAKLSRDDVVLEVGAGTGNLTRELAKKAGKVIAFEVDTRFKPLLKDLSENIELCFEDAWEYIQLHGKFNKKKEYNKVVSNLPFSFAEKFLHNLTFLQYDKVILLVPRSFVYKIASNPIFSSFFESVEKFEVKKESFYPIPDTSSAVMELRKLSDPIDSKNLALFLRQFIYQYEGNKVKNSLREGLIKYTWLTKKKRLTKKEAKRKVLESGIDKKLLESAPNNPQIYYQITKNFLDV